MPKGGVMFKVTKAQHVLAVNDFDSAVKYFTDKLGFTLENTIGGWAFLHLNNFYLMVGDCRGEVPAKETNNHALFAYVNCEGIDELYEQYKEQGVLFNQTISNKPWGLREFGVETPEGHRIMFGQEISA
jgi:uncharacterized glyoxalase superfamily protein PhnB